MESSDRENSFNGWYGIDKIYIYDGYGDVELEEPFSSIKQDGRMSVEMSTSIQSPNDPSNVGKRDETRSRRVN